MDLWREGRKEGATYLFVKKQGQKAGCTSCTRTRDSVGQDALGTRMPSRASAAGGSMWKGPSTWSQGSAVRLAAERLHRRAEVCWAEREEPRTISNRNTTALLKKHILGDLSGKGWTCRFNVPSPGNLLSQRCPPHGCGGGFHWNLTLTNRDKPLGSYFLAKKKLTQYIFLFSCHHLSVAVLNTSTIHSRISSQTSPGEMLHTHSRLLINSILKKHIPLYRWVVLWSDLNDILHKGPCHSTLQKHHLQ